MKKKTFALIVAAGGSRRFGGEIPKPYEALNGQMVLRYSLQTFLNHPEIDGVRVVIRREDHPLYKQATQGLSFCPPVIGGQTRQHSVLFGLDAIARFQPDHVLIHDAARPLVSTDMISHVCQSLESYQAVLPALPVVDTLKKRHADGTLNTVDRDNMFAAQTPQGFHFTPVYNAHMRYIAEPFTDDIALAEKAGFTIGLVEGERQNFKLTTREDLLWMQHHV